MSEVMRDRRGRLFTSFDVPVSTIILGEWVEGMIIMTEYNLGVLSM